MERKGITPVVAVVLLIGVTVAGGYTIYQMFSGAKSVADDYRPKLQLSQNTLKIESCWGSPGDPRLAVRNTGSKTINVTNLPLRINGSSIQKGSDYQLSENIVDPHETFRIHITIPEPINSQTRIGVLTTTETIRYKCLNIG